MRRAFLWALLVLVLVVVLVPVLAAATELGRVAVTMPRRSWAQVTTVNPEIVSQYFGDADGVPGGGSTQVPGYDDNCIAWNSKKRIAYIVTVTDPGTINRPSSPLFSYTDDTNTWTSGPAPNVTGYHCYDGVAWDDTNEVLYWRPGLYGLTTVYRYCVNNTPSWCVGKQGVWSTLPTPDPVVGCYQIGIAMTFHPTMDGGSLLCYDGERGVVQFRESTQTWSGILPGTNVQTGPYNVCAEYSPIYQVTVFGCSSNQVYKINDNKVVTQLQSAPVSLSLGTGSARQMVADPVTGKFIVVAGQQGSYARLYELDPGGSGQWTLIDSDLTQSGEICNQFVGDGCGSWFYMTAVPTYGVIMAWKFHSSAPNAASVWLYKHEEFMDGPKKTWNERSAASGVVRAVDFDSTAWFTTCGGDCWGSDFGINPAGGAGGTVRAFRDLTVAADGTSSLRFDIPGNTGADTSGSWSIRFSTDTLTQFGASDLFFVSWRQRFSPELLNTNFTNSDGFKQANIGHGDTPACAPGNANSTICSTSCSPLEVVTQNLAQRGLPQMYNSCTGSSTHGGFWGFDINEDGVIKLQNAIPSPYCIYPAGAAPCVRYVANEWMTFTIAIKTGPRGSSGNDEFVGSVVQAWVQRDGQTPVKTFNVYPSPGHTTPVGFNLTAGPAANNWKFGKIWLLPYQTNKSSSQAHATAFTWYDSLIISRTPIAPATLSTGAGPGSPPAAPSNLRLLNP